MAAKVKTSKEAKTTKEIKEAKSIVKDTMIKEDAYEKIPMGEGKAVKKIGVLTSGGDAPGMNAAVRAVVRTAINYGMEVVGIRRGFSGLIENDYVPLTGRSVADTIAKGGTFLYTARCPEMITKEGQDIVQKLTDKYIKDIDKAIEEKAQEIMKV